MIISNKKAKKHSKKPVFLISLFIFLFAGAVLLGYESAMILKQKQTDALLSEAYKKDTEDNTQNDTENADDRIESVTEIIPATEDASETPAAEVIVPDIPIDFETLQEDNPDIYAWITIADTKIDYPVLRSSEDDTDYYLNHTVTGASGLPGSIYTESIFNGSDFTDSVTVLYGHNMRNGSMFGDLDRYSNSDYREQHKNITIYTPSKILNYEVVFAVTYTDDLILSKYDCTTAAGMESFLASVRSLSGEKNWVQDPFPVTSDNRLIILSTCNGNSSQRYLVGACLISSEGE